MTLVAAALGRGHGDRVPWYFALQGTRRQVVSFGTTPLLERRRIFHSRDVEETRAFLRTKEFRFDPVVREARRLDARINGVYMPGMYLGYIQYGTGVTIRAMPVRDDYWVQLPIRGHIEVSVGHKSIACDFRRAVVMCPGHENVMYSDAGSARLNLSLTTGELTRLLGALLGEPPSTRLEFAPVLDVRTGYGRSLARYLRLAIAEFERADSLLWNSMAMTQFAQFVLTGLLLSHPHNHTDALRRLEKPIAPGDVKRAIDYLQANLQSAISLADIVAESGVPGRTLFKHFQDYRGTSPMRYLRKIRLEQVRESLRKASSEESVTEIAMHWGFRHLGRFSVEYRKRFGESPSETLGHHATKS